MRTMMATAQWTTIATAQWTIPYGMMGDDVSDDSDGATGNNDYVNGDVPTGDYVNDDGGGVWATTTTSMAMA